MRGEIEMKLREILKVENDVKIYQAIIEEWWDDIEETKWITIEGNILKKEVTNENLLDGNFLLRGLITFNDGTNLSCWLMTVMPEGVIEDVYFIGKDGRVSSERWVKLKKERVVCLVPIEKYVNSEIYYLKSNPEIGMNILKEGLKQSKEKWFYALELAEILRDEKKYSEAISFFEVVVENTTSQAIQNNCLREIEFIKDNFSQNL
jgi:hypothetical protein